MDNDDGITAVCVVSGADTVVRDRGACAAVAADGTRVGRGAGWLVGSRRHVLLPTGLMFDRVAFIVGET